MVRKRRLRLGSAARSHFPAPLRRLAFLHRSLHRSGKDERTVTTACLQPDVTNGLQGPTSFKGQTRAHLILARRDDLHLKVEYICADLSSRPNFSLQSRGGPYIRNSLEQARRGGWRMTGAAGRRQGGDFLPLNPPQKEMPFTRLVVGFTAIFE